jgi:hypothetical protein
MGAEGPDSCHMHSSYNSTSSRSVSLDKSPHLLSLSGLVCEMGLSVEPASRACCKGFTAVSGTQNAKVWWSIPVIPATREAEVGW